MKTPQERILLVESNQDISDVIARQTLEAVGYRVDLAEDAAKAIQQTGRSAPDAVIVNLNLPGLSGKDLLVALNAQGLDVPVIVIARKGMESDVIQAFRLGASDYLLWPAREAEIVAVVERVLKGVRGRQERETLSQQLKGANEELHQRVSELTTIFAIGKAVTSVTDLNELLEKILEAAIYVSESDLGWLLLREERGKKFLLRAQHNLPPSLAVRLNGSWDDGISSLVAMSGEPLSIHGEPLKRFKVSQLGQATLVTPLKVKKEVVGLLVVMRKADRPFSVGNVRLMEAVGDYASISLVNTRLILALEERARSYQQMADHAQRQEQQAEATLGSASSQIEAQLDSARQALNSLLQMEDARLNATQKSTLRAVLENLQHASELATASKTPLHKRPPPGM